MDAYIGTKIVRAEPQDKPNGIKHIPGYKVVYEDGYTSWSPKDVFERCYRKVTEAEAALVEREVA